MEVSPQGSLLWRWQHGRQVVFEIELNLKFLSLCDGLKSHLLESWHLFPIPNATLALFLRANINCATCQGEFRHAKQ